MKRTLNIILALCLFIICLPTTYVRAEEAKKPLHVSLKDALRIAQEKQINLILAHERVAQAIARLGQNRSIFFPQVSGVATEKRQTADLRSTGNIIPTIGPKIGPYNSYDARVKLTQTLFDVSAIKRFQAARNGQELSLAEQSKAKQDVLALIATLYVEASRANDKAELIRSLLKRDQKLLDITYRRLHLGTGSDLQLKKAKTQYLKSLHEWRAAHKMEKENRLDLLAALGMPLGQSVVFDKNDIAIVNSMPISEPFTIEDHPDVKVAQKQIEQSKAESAGERAEYLPKISAIGDYGSSGENPDHSSNTYMMGLQATMPFLEGGNRTARIKEAESRVKENEAKFDDTKIHVEVNILIARDTVSDAKVFLREKNGAYHVAMQEYRLAMHRFKMGTDSEAGILEAEANKALAQDQKNEALATYIIAQVNLAHALGQMDTFTEYIKP